MNGLSVPDVLRRTSDEISAILGAIRTGRAEFEQSTAEHLQRTRDKLKEISSATEVAATDMLDGLDRSLSLTDQLEACSDDAAAREIRQTLRDELGRLFIALQFQDITAQQLAHASRMLADVEHQLTVVAAHFDAAILGMAAPTVPAEVVPVNLGFDPAASLFNAVDRQAVADEIFHSS